LEDGSQATNYVLTSIDGSGNAQWKPAQTSTTIISQGVATRFGFNGPGVDIPFKTSENTFYKTGSYIDLPYGTWQITVNMLLAVDVIPSTMTANDWLWIKSSFSKVNAATITSSQITTDFVRPGPVYGSALFDGPKLISDQPKFNILRGTFIIKNSDTASTDANPTRYWYYGGLVDSQEYTTGFGKATKFTKFGGYWGEDVITAVRIL